MKNNLFDEEDKKFIQNFNAVGIIVAAISWYLIISHGTGVYDPWSKKQSSVTLMFDNWIDLIGGAIYPVIMIANGQILGWLMVALILLSLIICAWNKLLGSVLLLSATVIINYAANGLGINLLFMAGTLFAPIALIVYGLTGAAVVIIDEMKNTAKRLKD